jgi:hypothetical protein
MASLLFNCPTTHQQAPTGIETDVQSPSSRLEGHALTHDCGPRLRRPPPGQEDGPRGGAHKLMFAELKRLVYLCPK